MSVTEQTPYVEYVGNGSTISFPLIFDCNNADNLIVKVDGIDAVGQWILQDTTVVFTTAPIANSIISIERNTPLERTTNYQTYDDSFNPFSVNKDFDYIWLKLQELGYTDDQIKKALIKLQEQITSNDSDIAELFQNDKDLKSYIDMVLAMSNPNIFDGITARIVIAKDGKSVQTHLDDTESKLLDEIERSKSSELNISTALNEESSRAKSIESNLQLQISTASAGIKYFSTEAELLAFTPSTSDPKQAYAFDTKKNYLWNGSWINEGLSALDQAKALINKNFTSTHPILVDRNNILTTKKLAIFLPIKTLYINRLNTVIAGDLANTSSTEIPTHVKFEFDSTDALNTIYYNLSSNKYELAVYPNLAPAESIPILSLWNNYSVTNYTGIGLRELNSKISNKFNFSKSKDLLSIPFLHNSTTVIDSVTDVAAQGFDKSLANNSSENRPYGGGYISPKKNDYVFFRCLVKTSAENTFAAVQVFLWSANSVVQQINLSIEKSISTSLAWFTGWAKINVDNIDHFLIGAETQSVSYQHHIAGIQVAVSEDYIYNISSSDYPRYIGTTNIDIVGLNAVNIAKSNKVANTAITIVQKPTATYNTKIVYGQSLARGQETFPALSTVNKFNNVMLGNSILPNGYDANSSGDYVPFGDSLLHPLIANVVNDGGDTLLTDTQVNALSRGNGAFGESPNHGWVNGAKYYLNQMLMTANDSRKFVTFNAAVSGRSIEQLSKDQTVDSNNRFGRFKNGISKIHNAANGDHVVDGIFWAQGEWNYRDVLSNGADTTKSGYKAKFETLINNMWTACQNVTSQPNVPAFFTYQTGAGFTVDLDANSTAGLNVGMAQLELSLKKDAVFMVTPIYHLTDKGGHLDANGSRWLGNYIAKVHHKVVHLGQNWQPLRPTSIKKTANEIYISFHVPHPPLQFKAMYDGSSAVTKQNYGFKVTRHADNSTVTITKVEIVADTIVKLTLSETATSAMDVWYASQSTNGGGNLCDSDPFVAYDKYEYKAGTSMYPEANIADLVGKPYPLQNWCVAFFYPVGYSE